MGFSYQEYLASREWALKREQVRERSKGYCERCGIGPQQAVHHLNYARVGNENLEDLQAICDPCHEFESGKSNHDPAADLVFVVVAVSRAAVNEGRTPWMNQEWEKTNSRLFGKIEPENLAAVIPLKANPCGDGWLPERYKK